MSPEDIKPEWVDKAKYAIERWFDMNQPVPTGAVRDALAAVLPEAMAEALAKYLDAYVEAQPRMGDSNAAFAVLREMAAEVNRLREGSKP
jgi:hypothetical protein